MNKLVVFISSLFSIAVVSVAGKQITDSLTENNTFASWALAANLTQFQWIPAYTRSIWWFIPVLCLVCLFIWVMKREEPQMPSYMPPQMPRQRMPKPPKPVKQKKQPPNIYFGGGR